MNRNQLIFLSALLAGCATAEQAKDLDERVAALEEKVAELSAKGVGGGGPSAASEAKAKELYTKVSDSLKKGDYAAAKKQLAVMEKNHGDTTTYKRARKIKAELDVIGKAVPANWNMDKWYQGEAETDWSKPTLLVFWEVWCPHCKREVPKLKDTHTKFKGDGLQVIGLTKVNRSATDEKVTAFIEEQGIDYAIAKENGDMTQHFNVSGVPAAAMVKDGKIVWRGHPARLTDDMIKGWL
jgi:thiol-disulfide isomerase/thioredoxin